MVLSFLFTAKMFELVVEACVYALGAYAGIGLLFALYFVFLGVQRIDSQAQGVSFGFRLLILPGVVALWPFILSRWARSRTGTPSKTNPQP